jgi:hypothetical protein
MSKYNISNYLCETVLPEEVVPKIPICSVEMGDDIWTVEPPIEKITITADQIGAIICAYRTAEEYASDKLYQYKQYENLQNKYKEAYEDTKDAFHQHMYEEFNKDMQTCFELYKAQKDIAADLRSYLFVIGIHV